MLYEKPGALAPATKIQCSRSEHLRAPASMNRRAKPGGSNVYRAKPDTLTPGRSPVYPPGRSPVSPSPPFNVKGGWKPAHLYLVLGIDGIGLLGDHPHIVLDEGGRPLVYSQEMLFTPRD